MSRIILPALLAAGMLAAATPSLLAQPAPLPTPPRITVTGQGEASVRPDMAILSLTVMREAETARAALDSANEAMAAVTAAMREAGIEPRDLQTGGINIGPRYSYPQPGDRNQEPRIVAYQVQNTLTVRIRDIEKAGEILDLSVTLGVNQGGGITFTSDDPSATITEARKRAVEDATARARTIAEAAGISLGPIIEITEGGQSNQPPRPFMARQAMDEAQSAVPVEAGENSYRIHVTVSFGIAPN